MGISSSSCCWSTLSRISSRRAMSSSVNMVCACEGRSRWYCLVTSWMILFSLRCLSCWECPCRSLSSSFSSSYSAACSLALHLSSSRCSSRRLGAGAGGGAIRPVCSSMPAKTCLTASSFSICLRRSSFSRSCCSKRMSSCVALRSYSTRSLSLASSACFPSCSARSSLSLRRVFSSASEMSSMRRAGQGCSLALRSVAWRSPSVRTNLLSGERCSIGWRRSRKWVCFFSVEVTLRMRSARQISTFLREVCAGSGIWTQRYLGS